MLHTAEAFNKCATQSARIAAETISSDYLEPLSRGVDHELRAASPTHVILAASVAGAGTTRCRRHKGREKARKQVFQFHKGPKPTIVVLSG